jgi:hypothetical protein
MFQPPQDFRATSPAARRAPYSFRPGLEEVFAGCCGILTTEGLEEGFARLAGLRAQIERLKKSGL